ncbi:MAG: glycosyltransferase family 2 protein [Candidatus Zixiibacteriota bacterium]
MPNSEILVAFFSFNEGEKLKNLIHSFPENRPYDLLFVDDGSNDGSADYIKARGYELIRHEKNIGIGYGIREAIQYGRQHAYRIIVIMAANGKMQTSEIKRLTTPLINDRCDYVQGSRYLPGGQSANLPLFRKIMIRLFTFIAYILTGYRGTDVTCGFRAYKLSLFDDRRFNIDQEWLNKYEMEYYIHFHVIRGGYRLLEVPVSMIYPSEKRNYSKIKPFIGWWSMVKPWVYLILRIRK